MSGFTKFLAATLRHPINLGTATVKQIAHEIEVLNQQEELAKQTLAKSAPVISVAELDEEQLQAELKRRAAMRKAQLK
jgi:hypothetical protein